MSSVHPGVPEKRNRKSIDPGDPALIDWTARQAEAWVPFEVVDGRPVNPGEKTAFGPGINGFNHWGEAKVVDAFVTADADESRWLIMVKRGDGSGWALPGGFVDPEDESSMAAAIREFKEETGVSRLDGRVVEGAIWVESPPEYVPDPRASNESWVVTRVSSVRLKDCRFAELPALVGSDDADEAAWVRADTYQVLVQHLEEVHEGRVFVAHEGVLQRRLF